MATYHIEPFTKLSAVALYAILKARSQIFVVEQQCVYQDMDELDTHCWHGRCVGFNDELMAYCRIIPPQHLTQLPTIGRVLVMPAFRRRGLAR